MIDKETARARAEECRKVARHAARTPIAKENWERLAQEWEALLESRNDQQQAAGKCDHIKHESDPGSRTPATDSSCVRKGHFDI